ncbi:universal stress protein [Kitasatospora mediocidica]|uniref:universal stress protein n=1 Tax=Kitasatospora mediocidica TaxID=58352 RepID=UPI000A87AB12|nr:universal stress protein [Kitasatospora mediocidica]
MIRHVVVGVDGSQASLRAAQWAAREALLRGLPLRLLNAYPLLPHLLPTPSQGVEPADGRARGDLRSVESRLARSHPRLELMVDQIVDLPSVALLAASEDAELLVLGARGQGGFRELRVGSVGLHSAARAYCPAVLVRSRAGEGEAQAQWPALREIVLGLDAHDPAEAAAAFAFESAERHACRLRVVHACVHPSGQATGGVVFGRRREAQARLLDEVLADWRKHYPDVPVIQELADVGPAEALVRAAEKADLLVVGRREWADGHPAGLGSTLPAVLQHVPGPIAVVPVASAPDLRAWPPLEHHLGEAAGARHRRR